MTGCTSHQQTAATEELDMDALQSHLVRSYEHTAREILGCEIICGAPKILEVKG